MTRSLPRLPSGVYFSLLADSATNEADYVPEYPTFPSFGEAEGRQNSQRGPVASTGVGDTPNLIGDLPIRPRQLCLPLVSVSIDVQVDHSIAKTTVVQTFTNQGSISIPQATYSFPLYDGAAITAFRCAVGEDKVLEGKVKPTEEAKQEFQLAVQKQEAAALVEEMTPEVFQTTIGNIAPKTSIMTEITYVEELHTDLSGDGIILTIPNSVAPRYGAPPAGYRENTAVKETGLSLVISVASSGSVKPIACRSGHEISIEYKRTAQVPEDAEFRCPGGIDSQPDSNVDPKHTTVRLSHDQTAMDRDFILFIPWSGESLPRSRAVLARSSDSDHAAMMVTVRPSELFSDLRESMNEFDGEILFLADRSGSMRGDKIEELRNALFVFLKSLPAKCRFNLYSFGSSVSGLWPSSMPYNESTMQQALDHISTFEADFGGTEVLNALRKAVSDRRSTEASSTQVILLTDGEIWHAEQTIEFVRENTSKAEGQMRFFSLGIGNRVSHQLIQGIGLYGGGFGEVADVDAAGKWKEAVIRILKGAIMPNSWSYSISLGDNWDEKRLDMDDILLQRYITQSPGQSSGALKPAFFQAPRKIPLLHHFGQQSVYFLLDASNDKIPEFVVITASSQYGGTRKAMLEVTRPTLNNTAIQHLAAKAAVRDLESQDASEADSSSLIRRNAEILGQKYTITSKWTSFVAVSHLQQSVDHEDVEVGLYKAPMAKLDPLVVSPSSSEQRSFQKLSFRGQIPRPHMPLSQASSYDHASSSTDTRGFIMPPATRASMTGAFGAGPSFDLSLGSVQKFAQASLGTQSARSAGGAFGAFAVHAPRVPIHRAERFGARSKSKTNAPATNHRAFKLAESTSFFDSLKGASFLSSEGSGSPIMNDADSTSLSRRADSPSEISWEEVVRCQRIDGLFDLEQGLAHRMAKHFCHGTQLAIGRWLAAAVNTQGGGSDRLLVDTVMALAYMRSHFYPERAMWELLVQKAEGSLASRLEPGQWERPDGPMAMADSALAHAHYGRPSQDSGGVDWWKCGPGGGCCGVCPTPLGEALPSTEHNDELAECSFPRCQLSTGPWDKFWSHATEKGHIKSSCEAAKQRYEAAAAKDGST